MTSTTTSTAVPTVDRAQDAACTSCPHPIAAHDAISLRFCRATEARADETTTRGCVCPSS